MELRDSRTPSLSALDVEYADEPATDWGLATRRLLTGDDHVPDVVAPPEGHPRFVLLDGVRAVAALAILVTHAAFASGGSSAWYGRFAARLDVGVAIFFALAGFLLFRPYVAEHLDHVRAPAFRRYWFRRGLRIVPAYWLALTLLLILGLITLDSRWWEHYGLVQIYDRYEVLGGNVGAWSLAVELSFYLALPLAVLAMRSPRFGADRRSRVRGAALLVAGIWFAGVAFRLIAHGYTGSRASIAYDTLFAHLDWFAIGMGLAVLSAAMAGGSARPASVAWIEEHAGLTWLAALAVFVYVSVGLGESGNWSEPHGTFGWLMMHVLYGVIAGLLLAPAIFPGARRSLVHDFLGHPVVGGLGVISYGVFLYNGPIAAWLGRSKLSGLWAGRPFYGIVLATLVLSITAAVFSYRLVERPLLRFKDWRPEPATARSPEPAPPAG